MNELSDKHIRLIQLGNFLIVFLFVAMAIPISLFHNSILAGVKLMTIVLVFWGPVVVLFLKLFEVQLNGDQIVLRNLFVKYHYDRTDFKELSPTFLPLIYRISFKDSKYHFFMVPVERIFRILFEDRNLLAERMARLIKD